MSACYKTSNNKYFNAPPLMSDGRHFTDYRSSCVANAMIHVNNKLTNSYDFRTYLIRNAKNIEKSQGLFLVSVSLLLIVLF